jgi:hypothetical protein
MTDKEKELIARYPEAQLIVNMAESAWKGNIKAARIDFSLSDRLKAELKELLDKDINSIFITDSDVRHIKIIPKMQNASSEKIVLPAIPNSNINHERH